MKNFLNYTRLFTLAGLIIGLDQWTKSLVRTLPLGDTWLPAGWEWLMPYARIVHWYNTGAAFGSFANYGWVFTILAFVVVGLIIYYYSQVDDADWWLKLAMSMQMAGALGNVIDRLTNNGEVTDFISIGTFAVFNVADASISLGVVVLLIGVWLKDRKERRISVAESTITPGQEKILDQPENESTGIDGEPARD